MNNLITIWFLCLIQVVVGGEIQVEESDGKVKELKKKSGGKIFSAFTPKKKKKKKEAEEEHNPILDSVRFIPIEEDDDYTVVSMINDSMIKFLISMEDIGRYCVVLCMENYTEP